MIWNEAKKEFSLEPKARHKKSEYIWSILRFYFEWEHALSWDVQVIATVSDCIIDEIAFETPSIIREYVLGEEGFTIALPKVKAFP